MRALPLVLNYRRDLLLAGAVNIGREWRQLPTIKRGNPFVERRHGRREQVIAKYRAWICEKPEMMAAPQVVRGCDLVCFCAPTPHHCDVRKLPNAAAGDMP